LDRNRFSQIDIGSSWTEIVRFLILSNVTIFVVQEVFHLQDFLAQNFGLIPADFFSGKIWQLVTYMFLHAPLPHFSHILFNMLALWMFGSVLERTWGSTEFLKYYLLTGLGGGLCYALFNMHSPVPTVGASGAIYGLLVAYAVLFPDSVIYVWFVIPLKAKWFALIFGGIEFLASFRSDSGVAHLAHLGGMALGYLYLKRNRFLPQMGDWKEKRARAAEKREADEMDRIRREVDELLDKINRVGMNGLTPSEQKRLAEASRRLREWEQRG
jgi:membrane associated rhomboid family serine protease